MKMISNLIPLQHLYTHHGVEISFFNNLSEIGLVEITTIEQTLYVSNEKLEDIEKILRLHHELEINMEGIDVIINLLHQLENKETELKKLQNKLHFYEG